MLWAAWGLGLAWLVCYVGREVSSFVHWAREGKWSPPVARGLEIGHFVLDAGTVLFKCAGFACLIAGLWPWVPILLPRVLH